MCKSIEIGEMNKLIRTTHLFDASQSDRLLCILWRRLVFRPSGTMTKKNLNGLSLTCVNVFQFAIDSDDSIAKLLQSFHLLQRIPCHL